MACAEQPHSTNIPPPRVRKRARRRKGPPQLQFLTATDPSEFKGEKAKRSVRSQAMIQYRYQTAEQKKHSQNALSKERVVPIHKEKAGTSQLPRELEWHAYSRASSGQWRIVQYRDADADSRWKPYIPPRYARDLTTMPLNPAAERVVEYEDERDAVLLHLLTTKFVTSCVGNNLDPFSVIPRFATDELDSRQLVRSCNRAFVSKQTLARWVPAMLAHPHILLSSTIMASTWLDMVEGVCGESRRTILVKSEIISWINERLHHPKTMFHDDTIMIILHLLMGETWSCDEGTLRIHMSGIARLMSARGNLGVAPTFDTVGLATAIVCAHVPIVCEMTPLPTLCQFHAPGFVLVDESKPLPESPLYCPREQMYSVVSDPACSGHTYDVLCDVRDLTELFLEYSNNLKDFLEVESETEHLRLQTLSIDYDVKVRQFRTKLASLPSASTPGLPTTNDWIYEACRLAALIHTSAIITCVPFSVAADPMFNAVVRAARPISERLPTKRLTESLYEAVERTNTGDLWNNMLGVFYWVCATGAAAARTPVSINSSSRPSTQNEAYSTWVRRCLTMCATRSLGQMIFEHPLPLMATQRKMLRIQELIGRGGSRSQAFHS